MKKIIIRFHIQYETKELQAVFLEHVFGVGTYININLFFY